MNKSEELNELATALSLAQGMMETAKKDSENPFYHAVYADLASIWEACRKPLTDNGLSVVQTTDNEDGKVIIETTLLHKSGQWITGKLSLKPKPRNDKESGGKIEDDVQSVGSAITYGRRYALAAIVGVCPDDDDGEAAMGRKPVKTEIKKQTSGPPATVPQTTGRPGKPVTNDDAENDRQAEQVADFAKMQSAVDANHLPAQEKRAGEAVLAPIKGTESPQGTAQEAKQVESLLKGQPEPASTNQVKAVNAIKTRLGEDKFWTMAHKCLIQSIASLSAVDAAQLIKEGNLIK